MRLVKRIPTCCDVEMSTANSKSELFKSMLPVATVSSASSLTTFTWAEILITVGSLTVIDICLKEDAPRTSVATTFRT